MTFVRFKRAGRFARVALGGILLGAMSGAASAPERATVLHEWGAGLDIDSRAIGEIADFRYKDEPLGEEYAKAFAQDLRRLLFASAETELRKVQTGASEPFINVEFPEPGFTSGVEPARKVERKFEEGFTYSELVARFHIEGVTPRQALAQYTSSDLRMSSSSRIKRIWLEDGLDCVETSGITAVLSPTLTCSRVDEIHEEGMSVEHSQLVTNPGGDDYQTVYFKESLKTCVATADGLLLHYANYTWTGKLGSIKRHFGRKGIIESREKAIEALRERLQESAASE